MVLGRKFGNSEFGINCPICIEQPQEDEMWFIPNCTHKHMMKLSCAEHLRKVSAAKKDPMVCPICRAPIKWDECVIRQVEVST